MPCAVYLLVGFFPIFSLLLTSPVGGQLDFEIGLERHTGLLSTVGSEKEIPLELVEGWFCQTLIVLFFTLDIFYNNVSCLEHNNLKNKIRHFLR